MHKNSSLTTIPSTRIRKYRLYANVNGVDIVAASRRNLSRLRKQLKPLTSEEQRFHNYFISVLVPKLVATHGTVYLASIRQSGALMPVADRVRMTSSVVKSNTGGRANLEFIYFSLGIEDKQRRPRFLASDCDAICLNFREFTEDDENCLRGMFITEHYYYYQTSRRVLHQFGDTRVRTYFDKQTMTRTSTYFRGDGEQVSVSWRFGDNTFSTEDSFTDLYEGIVLRLIEQVRLIGDIEFSKKFYALDNEQWLVAAIHDILPSETYLELKLPVARLPISAHYVSFKNISPILHKNVHDLIQAARHFRATDLEAALTKVDANVKTSEGNTALDELIISLGKNDREYKDDRFKADVMSCIHILLANGIDVGHQNNFNTTLTRVFKHDFTVIKDKDPEFRIMIFKTLLKGSENPACPMSRYLPTIKSIDIETALSNCKKTYFSLMHEFDPTAPLPDSTLIKALSNDYDLEFIKKLILLGANINVIYNDLSLLMHAIIEDDLKFFSELLKDSHLNYNYTVYSGNRNYSEHEGRSALHVAVFYGRKEMVSQLLALGVLTNILDVHGDTAGSLLARILSGELIPVSEAEKQHRYHLSRVLANDEEFTPKAMTVEQLQPYEAIKLLFDKYSISVNAKEKGNLPLVNSRMHAVVGIVVGTFRGERSVVLVRKANHYGQAAGCYLAPGGCVERGESELEALERELYEETGLRINEFESRSTLFYRFHKIQNRRKISIPIFLIKVDCLDKFSLSGSEEIAEVTIVPFHKLQSQKILSHDPVYFFNNIPILYSNSLLLHAYLADRNPIDDRELSTKINIHFEPRVATKDFDRFCNLCVTDSIPEDEIKFVRTKILLGQFVANRILLLACTIGHAKLAKLAIYLGADVNYYSNELLLMNTDNPLVTAIECGHQELAKMLIEDHAADAGFSAGVLSVIGIACIQGDLEFLKYLLSKCAILSDEAIGVALISAMTAGQGNCFEYLLNRYRLNLNRPYPYRSLLGTQTIYPLHAAIQLGLAGCVKMLLEHGASVYTFNAYGKSTIELAKQLKDKNRLDKQSAKFDAESESINTKETLPILKAFAALKAEAHKKLLVGEFDRIDAAYEQIIEYLEATLQAGDELHMSLV